METLKEDFKRYVWALVALWMTMMYAWELTRSVHYLEMADRSTDMFEVCMGDLRELHFLAQRWR